MNTTDMKFTHSEQINEIAEALCKAQSKMKPAVINKVNPHFKSRYADYNAIVEACRTPLSENGILFTHMHANIENQLHIVTMLIHHKSGQWFKSSFPVIGATVQALGSATTYGKRYGLSSLTGMVADEDDDGEIAETRPAQVAAVPKSKLSPDQINTLRRKDEKLDDETKMKLKGWLNVHYHTSKFEDLLVVNFAAVNAKYESAVKYVQTLEPVHV